MTDSEKNMIELLQCISCKSDLSFYQKNLCCNNCKQKYEVNGRVVKMMPKISKEMAHQICKWDELYKKELKSKEFLKNYKLFVERYLDKTLKQLLFASKMHKSRVYLEIGSGYFFIGQNIAKQSRLAIGLEICPTAIKISKKMLEERKVENYLLIQGDLLHTPIKDNKVDLVYGGGVIEHFQNTQQCINEIFRVLKKGGVSFNTVPYLNLGSLLYRQMFGNIPNFPVLKQASIFFHTKILRGRHMRYGFEMSFLGSTLKRIHKKAGFEKTSIERFDVTPYFEFIPSSFRRPAVWLAENSRMFWPMIKVIATK